MKTKCCWFESIYVLLIYVQSIQTINTCLSSYNLSYISGLRRTIGVPYAFPRFGIRIPSKFSYNSLDLDLFISLQWSWLAPEIETCQSATQWTCPLILFLWLYCPSHLKVTAVTLLMHITHFLLFFSYMLKGQTFEPGPKVTCLWFQLLSQYECQL